MATEENFESRVLREAEELRRQDNTSAGHERAPGGGLILGAKAWWDTPEHAELNAAARAAGATEEALAKAHEVAAGRRTLDEACTNCEEQGLRYSQRIRLEGKAAIICDNCGAHHVDANSLVAFSQETKRALKGLAVAR